MIPGPGSGGKPVTPIPVPPSSHHQNVGGAEAGALIERDGSVAGAQDYPGKVIPDGVVKQGVDQEVADALIPNAPRARTHWPGIPSG
jgi:hypothetical protein